MLAVDLQEKRKLLILFLNDGMVDLPNVHREFHLALLKLWSRSTRPSNPFLSFFFFVSRPPARVAADFSSLRGQFAG